MATTVRDTIKEITRKHLTEGIGKCYGQCLTAVGWVGGTLPELYEEDGMVEFSMADVAGGAILTGLALVGLGVGAGYLAAFNIKEISTSADKKK